MEAFLENQLKKTLYVHYPLKAEEGKGIEAKLFQKEIEKEIVLWDGVDESCWSFRGKGNTEFTGGMVDINTNSTENYWPETENPNGAYSTFGDYTLYLDVAGLDLAEYNQIYFEMKSECDGHHSPMVRAGFENDGVKKIPDVYSREGFNAITLENGTWCKRIWTITEIPHDKITKIFFRFHKYGKELSASENMRYQLKNIRMQKVKQTQVTKGWQCEKDTVSCSTSGYWTYGKKTAVANTSEESFSILDAETGSVVLQKNINTVNHTLGEFKIVDFSELETVGSYKIRIGENETEPFPIGNAILENAVWRVINFLFCERCGFPIPGKHGTCHQDVYVDHKDLRMIYTGGWHDAADVSQQTTQTAEVVHGLLECAEAVKDDEMLYLRLLEEAGWGMDFVLRTRFGDGYRASSAGLRRWTDNLIGNIDDVPGRCHNNPFDNFIMAGVEAMGAKLFLGTDPELAWKCRSAAMEDFAFAEQTFETEGIVRPLPQEHTYNASMSQHYAAAAWAAAGICEIAPDLEMADKSAAYLTKLINCQDQGEAVPGFMGFFYRDESKSHIVHFSHQAREHIFAQALVKAYEVLPDHKEAKSWKKAMESYGSYIKKLMDFGAPYGMIPAGIYCTDELEDEETFELVHPRLDFSVERANYEEQLKSGVAVNDRYCVRNFPVWFSFRGNNANMLSQGKGASLIGKALKDDALIEIAREQIYWIAGKNPFGNSFIYGEGHNFGKQYNALAGEIIGSLPVGTQTQENEDLPYWPMANIACYREIWTTSAGHWLWLAADLYYGGKQE